MFGGYENENPLHFATYEKNLTLFFFTKMYEKIMHYICLVRVQKRSQY